MNNLILISFQPDDQGFVAHIPLGDLSLIKNPEKSLKKASFDYAKAIQSMQGQLKELNEMKKNRKIIPARKIWKLGDSIFSLVDKMEQMLFCINGLYDHLTRELEVKKMWLEKVIIFRRYIADQKSIPKSLAWGKCSSSPRKATNLILSGKKL